MTFDYSRSGSVGNLSRIDPSLLGIKDTPVKNLLFLHGSNSPLLCFSLILVTCDNHERGRTIGTDPKWVFKDIVGVLPAMEQERLIAVLGLTYQLPYVPDDSARRESDLFYFSMIDNSFCFMTSMSKDSGKYHFIIYLFSMLTAYISEYEAALALAAGEKSSKSTSLQVDKGGFYAPASPAYSRKGATSSYAARKASIRPHETGMIFLLNVLSSFLTHIYF